MTSSQESVESRPFEQGARAAWLGLVAALIWIVIVRIPLVMNAEAHLDSDLAVDGLTLLEARAGHWRWHYPGTPHMGIVPVLLSLPQSLIWGVNASTLVSGGVVAYGLLIVATFVVTLRVFGPIAALGSLVPLAFCSTGTLWLSGRITGGHLLSAAWHASAFLGLASVVTRGGPWRASLFGLWCGLGMYLDQMFAYSLLGLVPAVVSVGFGPGKASRRLVSALAFVLAFGIGLVPRILGERSDSHDAYQSQFQTILTRNERTGAIDMPRAKQLAGEHARLLVQDCLPRLVAGYRLVPASAANAPWSITGLLHEPSVEALAGGVNRHDTPQWPPGAILACAIGGLMFVASMFSLLLPGLDDRQEQANAAVRSGLFVSAVATVGGFVLNLHIYNSDNYRYLVFLLVPIALGFGLLVERWARRGKPGWVAVLVVSGLIAMVFSLDTLLWYQRFGWVEGIRPVRAATADPALDWLEQHPGIDAIFGGYWDVYRLSFLTGGRVVGVPYPEYPNRFPEITRRYPGSRPRTLIARGDRLGAFNRQLALQQGGKTLFEGRRLWIIDWP